MFSKSARLYDAIYLGYSVRDLFPVLFAIWAAEKANASYEKDA